MITLVTYKLMAYNESLVIAGGVAHVPIVISILKFFDIKSSKTYNTKKSVEALAKKKLIAAKAEAQAKADAQAKAEGQKAVTATATLEKQNENESIQESSQES